MEKDKVSTAPDPKHAAAGAMAELIRRRSGQGELISEDEILACSLEQGLLDSGSGSNETQIKEILRLAMEGNQDINAVTVDDGSERYYSSQFVTEAYAAILLGKEGDPLKLIADVVRENSRLYPRPVPLDIFMMPPFDMSGQDIRRRVNQMNMEGAFRDIVPVTTSTSREFLYSSQFLRHEYAVFLAEWLDTGQSENP